MGGVVDKRDHGLIVSIYDYQPTGGKLMSLSSGLLITHSEIEEIIEGLRRSYSQISPEAIENYNKEIIEDWHKSQLATYTNNQPKSKVKPGQPGYVYMIAGPEGIYKIGKAKNLTERITHLGVKLPFPITQVHSIKSNNYSEAEKYFHNYFASKRGEGEWFALDQHDIEFFCSHENLDF